MSEAIREKLFYALCDFMISARRSVIRPVTTTLKPAISSLQFNVLLMLAYRGPASMSEIANNMALSKQQMTQIIKKMDEMGLVTRMTDTKDGRKILIKLSEKGRELAIEIKSQFLNYPEDRFENVTDEQIQEILTSMKAFTALLNDAD